MGERILRERDLGQIDGLSRTTRRRLIDAGKYPTPLMIAGSPYMKGWTASSVERWIEDQVRASQGEAVPA